MSLENRHAEGVENGVSAGARASGAGRGCCHLSVAQPPYVPLDGPTTYKLPADKGRLQCVPERRAAQQHFWPAACGELQATAKPRTVGRDSSGQFARSLRHSRVRAQYRARAARPARRALVDRPLGAGWATLYQCAVCSQGAAAWPASMGPPDGCRTGRLRAQAQAHARRFIARRAERRLRRLSRHWHTHTLPSRCIARPALGARVAGRRAWWWRTARRHPSTPQPAAAAAQVAVDHGARRRAQHATRCTPPLPWIGSTRPTSLRAQQPPFPWLGRWLVGAARHGAAGPATTQVYRISRVESESWSE